MLEQLTQFQLALPRAVRFGWGVRAELGPLVRGLGRRAWVVLGSRSLRASGMVDEVIQGLTAAGVAAELPATISREPCTTDVDSTVAELRRRGVQPDDVVVALGGGSAIDLAKAVAALVTNPHGETVADFLEGVGRGLTIEHPPLSVVAVPTTAGTGSEATRNAVITSLDPPFKKSLRSPHLVPAAVLLDPELTVSCPSAITAHSGMDAIAQLTESLLSRRANSLTSALCREGLQYALPALPTAVADPTDRPAREAMSYAAFLSGVALANSGLGLAHGVAAALGVHCGIPHGLACAVMLPHAMRFNRNVRPLQLAAIGRLLPEGIGLGDESALADAAILGMDALCRRIGISASLADLGVRKQQIDALIAGSRGNSLSGNPREVTDADLRALLPDAITPRGA